MESETTKPIPASPPALAVSETLTPRVADSAVPLQTPINIKRLLFAIVLVSAFAELSYAVVNLSAMPVYIPFIGLDKLWIGVVGTAYLVAEGVLKSPFGILGDRIGRKTLIIVGPIVSTVTCLLTPHVRNPFLLVLLRVLDGIGAAALWPAAFSMIGDYVPEAKRSSAMSLFNLAYIMGVALGPLMGGGLNDFAYNHLGFSIVASKQVSFYVASALFAVTAGVAILFLPGGKPLHHAPEEGATGEGGFNLKDFGRMLGQMPSTLLMAFITFLGIGLIMLYVKVFASDTLHITETQFGVLLLGPALVIALVSVPLGALGDKIGKANAVKIGIGLCAVSLWLLIAYPVKWNLMAMGALNGIGFVMAFPAWMALVSSSCAPSQRGAVVGAVGTAQGLGAILGAAASGFLYKVPALSLDFATIPKHYLNFIGCATMLTLSFILVLFTVRDPAPSAPPADTLA